MNAIADAIGDEIFRRAPVSLDIVLNALENGGQRTHEAAYGARSEAAFCSEDLKTLWP